MKTRIFLCLYVMASSVACLFGSLGLMQHGYVEWSLLLGFLSSGFSYAYGAMVEYNRQEMKRNP